MKKLLLALVLLGTPAIAEAADLVIGSAYKPYTADPHLSQLNDNTSILSHIYDHLIWQDETLALQPALAESWTLIDPTTWEIRLRDDAYFHDGTKLTSEDVIFTMDRIRRSVSAVDPYLPYVAHITGAVAIDRRTLRLITDAPHPQLPVDLASFFVVSHTSPADPARQIGSGPYVVDEFRNGDFVTLHANPRYWGNRPEWDHVRFRAIPSDPARTVALLAGDVDVIDFVPPQGLEQILAKHLKVVSLPAARSNFIEFDQSRDSTPFVTDAAGRPLPNPFRNPQVRLALSLAIDRQAIVQRILGGYATAAAQLFPPGFAGTSANLAPSKPDPARARQMIVDAGYKDGFTLTLHGTQDRYPGDSATLQAVAQMWTRIGVRTSPVPLPYSVYSAARNRGDYSAYYAGASGADISQIALSVLHTPDAAQGLGAQNPGGYSNAAVDTTLMLAAGEFDASRRNALFAQATEIAMAQQATIPLYHYHSIWAIGPKVAAFQAHPRGWTTAMQATPSTP